ncbi:hypothetical protein B0J11DRAFT_468355 [Dendryphion nanum]|uniref:DNA polymerase n=1 Tax=Dendryphion nanum TaxID=256645 RepID=A0A9P9DF43_9PLEO|nr:hypothetical protein B0J11DRAFT_468355 [Dendryphion nanum]
MDITSPLPSARSSSAENHETLALRSIPPVLVISTHFQDDELQEFTNTLRRHHAPITSDLTKAKVFIGKVGTKKRAGFELRNRKFKVEEIIQIKRVASPVKNADHPSKRRRIGTASKPITIDADGSTTEEGVEDSETEDEHQPDKQDTLVESTTNPFQFDASDDVIWVVKMDWLTRCIAAGRLLPLEDTLVYQGKVLERPVAPKPAKSITTFFKPPTLIQPASAPVSVNLPQQSQGIMDRAHLDAMYVPRRDWHGSQRFDGRTYTSGTQRPGHSSTHTANLLKQSTTDYEGDDSDLPPTPEWVKQGIKYSCQRITPANGPNQDFIELLKKIRTARILIDDQVGVRAYSTIIASIAAYPYRLAHPRELIHLPGCDEKAADLFVEWKNTGLIRAVADFEEDEDMKVLRLFYDIWGVGAKTARHFYFTNHWKDLDDIIEFGWQDLDRVQQIGVKFYEEFLDPIPRAEVESIAETVRQHAIRLRDSRITVTIVGGYRRGKKTSGDVDMIVSHPDLSATAGLIKEIVESLEAEEWITHTLTLSLHNTHRNQSTLPFRSTKAAGVGFDTLDKALVVWQKPSWPNRTSDLATDPHAKNPNIHRRVDIIVSPWRTVGCAVMGWSGGTTFQRDLRRYVKAVKGWKFDSSGVRSRSTGEVVCLEGVEGVDGTPEDAERRVFEGLGLGFVEARERCTE